MARNIEMNIKTESGYDVLYPSSTPSQVGCLATTGGTMSGNVNMNYNRIINVVTTGMNDAASKAKRYWSKQGNSWNFTFPETYVSFVWIQ